MMEIDAYAVWRAEQTSPTPEDKRHERNGDPKRIAGFWRILSARMKPDHPVAIWPQAGSGGDVVFFKIGAGRREGGSLFNTQEHDDRVQDFLQSTWLKCVAVTEDDYHAAMARARWSDNKPARELSDDEKLGLDIIPTTPASEGGNQPVDDDGNPIDEFHQQVTTKIQAELDKADKLPFPITKMDDAERAAAIIDQLRGLGTKGEAQRKIEKQPWLDGAAGVDAKWSLVKAASDKIKALVSIVDTFKRTEERRLAAEKAERERAERKRLQKIEQDRIAAEVAARAAEEGVNADDLPSAEDIAAQAAANAETLFAEQPKQEAPKVEIRGSAQSRAVSKAKVKRGVITDRAAFIAALTGQADFDEWLQDKANKLARAGTSLKGMEITNE